MCMFVFFYLIFSCLASAWLKQNGDAILEFLCLAPQKARSAKSLTSTQMTSDNVETKYFSNFRQYHFKSDKFLCFKKFNTNNIQWY